MAVAFTIDVPIDEDAYGRLRAEIGDETPKGLISHVVTKRAGGGLRYVDVWESRELWEQFRAERVDPAVMKVLGLTPEAREPSWTALELVDVMT